MKQYITEEFDPRDGVVYVTTYSVSAKSAHGKGLPMPVGIMPKDILSIHTDNECAYARYDSETDQIRVSVVLGRELTEQLTVTMVWI